MQLVLRLVALLVLSACGDDDVDYSCVNGHCPCFEGDECRIACAAPPCHIECERGSSCIAECGNGSCLCREGSECTFGCQSPPCHVTCGSGSACTGQCSNGACTCGSRSTCHFECLDSNCGASCGAGSSCTLACLAGRAGEGWCDFDQCAGDTELCPDGITVTCNAACPD